MFLRMTSLLMDPSYFTTSLQFRVIWQNHVFQKEDGVYGGEGEQGKVLPLSKMTSSCFQEYPQQQHISKKDVVLQGQGRSFRDSPQNGEPGVPTTTNGPLKPLVEMWGQT